MPELDAATPANVALEAELAVGVVSGRFHRARRHIAQRLAPLAASADAIIVHNAFTLHFSLPLTAVLWQIAGMTRSKTPILAWTHDLAWVNPLYIPCMHDGYPWDLMRFPAPGVRYVTVSHERKAELLGLWGGVDEPVTVVPNGVDAARLLRLSARVQEIVDRYNLFDLDLLLLLPVRITRRKNIEQAIGAVSALKQRGLEVRLVVTGPTAPHHPQRSRSYLEELKARRSALGVDHEVIFLADELDVMLAEHEIAELYALSDCLLFPSQSEGFGLPILEAGMTGVTVVASDIPIFREIGGEDITYFRPDASPEIVAETVLHAVDTPVGRLRRRVRRQYRWETIFDRLVMPMLAADAAPVTPAVGAPA